MPAGSRLAMSTNNETKRYRIHTKQLFLTYPKCNLELDVALSEISSILSIDKYIIAREKHTDGGAHIHMYIKCLNPADIRKPDKLDILGFHGNYQSCRSPNAVRKYCTKEGNYLTNIVDFKPIAAAIRVLSAESKKEAMDIIKNDPLLARDYIRDTSKMEESIARLYPNTSISRLKYRFRTMQSVISWKRKKHVLWLFGPTKTGKTEFAKSLFSNPLLVSHIDELKHFCATTHDGIIFDDMYFGNWSREHQIHLLDLENNRGINVKYGMIIIPHGTPRIFTSNVPIFTADAAIARRIRMIRIKEDIRLLSEQEQSPESESSTNSLEPEYDDYNSFVSP